MNNYTTNKINIQDYDLIVTSISFIQLFSFFILTLSKSGFKWSKP